MTLPAPSPSDNFEPLDHSESAERPTLPADVSLPPVEPPSARFIVQLFVAPALIVAAVIGVYLLFGKLASTEADWREHASDLRSSNPQVRWRGAYGLAQLLEADAVRIHKGPALADDPELSHDLAATLSQELDRKESGEDHDRLLDYLIKASAWLNSPDAVIPPLRKAIDPRQEEWLRQQGLNAIAMVAGRAREKGKPIDDPSLVDQLIGITVEPTNVLRNLAAFDLGLVESEAATARLESLLNHADRFTQLQAAIGMTRRGSLDGLPVFEDILTEAGGFPFDPKQVTNQDEAGRYFEMAKPTMQAITAAADLRKQLPPEEREKLIQLIEPLTQVPDGELRHHAVEKLALLKSTE